MSFSLRLGFFLLLSWISLVEVQAGLWSDFAARVCAKFARPKVEFLPHNISIWEDAHFKPHLGTSTSPDEVSRELRDMLHPGVEIFYLGLGIQGGAVYRIVEPDQSTWIAKDYFNYLSKKRDLERYEFLSPVIQEVSEPNMFGLSRMEDKVKGSQVLKVENRYGKTLMDLKISGDETEKGLYWKLEPIFRSKLKALAKAIEKHYPDYFVIFDDFGYLSIRNKKTQEEELYFYLKTSNILVDPLTLEMTIIDLF